MNKQRQIVDKELNDVATLIYKAEKEISLGINVQENEAKIDKLMSDTPFDKLCDLAQLVEVKISRDHQMNDFV